ncbi:hypothetical protein MTO96_020589 [Rhipicephalus appendiculatus]
MGGSLSCCSAPSPRPHRKKDSADPPHSEESASNLQHISEREPEDFDQDPSTHPTAGPLFMQRSKSDVRNCKEKRRSQINLQEKAPLKKSNSCSTIYLDDSTVSQPNLRCTIKCVTLAIYYHIRDRGGQQRTIDIFDERLHPLSKEPPEMRDPDHRTIYRFVRTLFNAAQLSAECAIITLVYLGDCSLMLRWTFLPAAGGGLSSVLFCLPPRCGMTRPFGMLTTARSSKKSQWRI